MEPQKDRDKKEVDNFINALNTTLNSLCINKPDSEIDEFDEVEVIDENDEHLNENNNNNNESDNSNEDTLKPDKDHVKPLDDYNFKSLANMTLGTLSATKKMQDRITILEE